MEQQLRGGNTALGSEKHMFRYLIHFLRGLIGASSRDVTCPRPVAHLGLIIHAISIIYLPIYVIITGVLWAGTRWRRNEVDYSEEFARSSFFRRYYTTKNVSSEAFFLDMAF